MLQNGLLKTLRPDLEESRHISFVQVLLKSSLMLFEMLVHDWV